jgi:hypothetical protein
MTVGGISNGVPLTPADLPSTSAVDGQLAELERQGSTLRDSNTGTFHTDLPKIGLVSGGIALVTGVASGVLAARSGAALSASAGIGAAIAAGGGLSAFAGMTLLGDTGGTADISDDLASLRRQRSSLVAERRPAAEVIELGVAPFNTVTERIMEQYDHDHDGSIDLRRGQPIEADERISPGNGTGPVRAESDYVNSLVKLLRPADAHGNGDHQVDARELATYLVDASQVDDELRTAVKLDGGRAEGGTLAPLYWTHVQYLGAKARGEASDFRPEVAPAD